MKVIHLFYLKKIQWSGVVAQLVDQPNIFFRKEVGSRRDSQKVPENRGAVCRN
jgi:hypothetical protein